MELLRGFGQRRLSCLLCLLVSFLIFFSGVGAQVSRQSREEVNNLNPSVKEVSKFFGCSRLFNVDGAVGCGATTRDGDAGLLRQVSSAASLDFLPDKKNGFAVLIEPELLQDVEFVQKLSKAESVGLLLVGDSSSIVEMNEAEKSSFNANGTNLTGVLFNFPVALLNADDTLDIKNRIIENLGRSDLWQHAAFMDFYVGLPDVTSTLCMGLSNRCQPLGGQSVWGTFAEDPNDKPIVLFTVKLDSDALFRDLSFAANDVASSLTVFLSVADALSDFMNNPSSDFNLLTFEKQIVFAAFQGESFDSIGSKRFIFDVQNACKLGTSNYNQTGDECKDEPFLYFTSFNNLNLSNVETIISLDNVGSYFSDITTYYVHSLNAGAATADILGSTAITFTASSVVGPLPKTPATTFVNQIPGFSGEVVVITGYDADISEVNPFFHSHFDRAPPEVDQSSSLEYQALASVIAQTLIKLATGTVVSAVPTLANVQELESCLTQEFSCSLVTDLLNMSTAFFESAFQNGLLLTNAAPDLPAPPRFYPGDYIPNIVTRRLAAGGVEFFTRNFLASRLSPSATFSEQATDVNCEDDLQCLDFIDVEDLNGTKTFVLGDSAVCEMARPTSAICVSGKCLCSTIFYHDAVSPAIAIAENNGVSIKSPLPAGFENEKIFTQPVLEIVPTLRVFQQGNGLTERVMLSFGIVGTAASILFTKIALRKLATTKYKIL